MESGGASRRENAVNQARGGTEGSPAFREYLREVGVAEPLQPHEERELIALAHGGDGDALNELMRRNQRLVLSIARKYRLYALPIMDLVQHGNIGLGRAIKKFDLGRGTRLSTYATRWIDKCIRAGLAREGWPIRRPSKVVDMQIKLSAARAALTPRLGREPAVAELASATRLSERQVLRARKLDFVVENFEDSLPSTASNPGAGQFTVGDTITDPDAVPVEDEALDAVLVAQIEEIMDDLPVIQRRVLTMRYLRGMDGPEVARKLGVRKQAVHQFEQLALDRIRMSLGLAEWLPPEKRKNPRRHVVVRTPR